MIESFPEWRGTRSGIFLFSCCASRSCFRSEVVLMRKNRPPTRKIAHARPEFASVHRKLAHPRKESLLCIANSLTPVENSRNKVSVCLQFCQKWYYIITIFFYKRILDVLGSCFAYCKGKSNKGGRQKWNTRYRGRLGFGYLSLCL